MACVINHQADLIISEYVFREYLRTVALPKWRNPFKNLAQVVGFITGGIAVGSVKVGDWLPDAAAVTSLSATVPDPGDAPIMLIAEHYHCDAIITYNVRHFRKFHIPALPPDKWLQANPPQGAWFAAGTSSP